MGDDVTDSNNFFLCYYIATDWYFLMYILERIYCTKADYNITLTENILDGDTKLQGVKEVMGFVEGLGSNR